MKNLTKALGIAGIVGASFLPLKSEGQDTIKKINSIKEFDNAGKRLDTLQILATNNYNNANIKFKECTEKEKNDLVCFGSLLYYLNSSKIALEEYISLFETNKIYEDGEVILKMGRALSIFESQEWLNNEKTIIKYVKDFLDNPNEERGEKWMNYFNYTTEQTNSYFPPEGVIDLGPVLEKD